MKQTQKLCVLICIFCCIFLGWGKKTLGRFTSNFPANTYSVRGLRASNRIDFRLNWSLPLTNSLTIGLTKVGDGTMCNSTTVSISPAIFDFTVAENGDYSVQITSSEQIPIPYTLAVTAKGTTTTYTDVGVSYNFGKGVYLINIPTACTYGAIESPDWARYDYFNFFRPSQIPTITSIDIGAFSQPSANIISAPFSEAGIYYMIPDSSTGGLWVTSRATIDFRCYDPVCGDGIREGSEQCDNGNNTGCVNCIADPSYSCVAVTPTSGPCNCWLPSFIYDIGTLQCIIDCTLIPNGIQNVLGTTDQCICLPQYFFDQTIYECVVNCNSVAGSLGSANGSCICPEKYYFSQPLLSCVINCSAIANTVGYDLAMNYDRCECKHQFAFNLVDLTCVINCTLMGGTGPVAGTLDQCACASGYQWTSDGCKSVCGDGIQSAD